MREHYGPLRVFLGGTCGAISIHWCPLSWATLVAGPQQVIYTTGAAVLTNNEGHAAQSSVQPCKNGFYTFTSCLCWSLRLDCRYWQCNLNCCRISAPSHPGAGDVVAIISGLVPIPRSHQPSGLLSANMEAVSTPNPPTSCKASPDLPLT